MIMHTHLASHDFRSLATVCLCGYFKSVLHAGIPILLAIRLHNIKLETYLYQYTPLAHILKSAVQALITNYLINLSDKARHILDQYKKNRNPHKTFIPCQKLI